MRVILASASQRRKQILEDLNYQVIVSPLNEVDETSSKHEVSQQVLEICHKKATSVKISSESPVIVSDTMLEDPDDESIALGKPHDSVQAAMMLHKLSGRRHRVWTATGLYFNQEWKFFLESSIVEVQPLTDQVLVDLVLSESWKGKAGGYDLAGPMARHAELVDGFESTVLGIASDALTELASLTNH